MHRPHDTHHSSSSSSSTINHATQLVVVAAADKRETSLESCCTAGSPLGVCGPPFLRQCAATIIAIIGVAASHGACKKNAVSCESALRQKAACGGMASVYDVCGYTDL